MLKFGFAWEFRSLSIDVDTVSFDQSTFTPLLQSPTSCGKWFKAISRESRLCRHSSIIAFNRIRISWSLCQPLPPSSYSLSPYALLAINSDMSNNSTESQLLICWFWAKQFRIREEYPFSSIPLVSCTTSAFSTKFSFEIGTAPTTIILFYYCWQSLWFVSLID